LGGTNECKNILLRSRHRLSKGKGKIKSWQLDRRESFLRVKLGEDILEKKDAERKEGLFLKDAEKGLEERRMTKVWIHLILCQLEIREVWIKAKKGMAGGKTGNTRVGDSEGEEMKIQGWKTQSGW